MDEFHKYMDDVRIKQSGGATLPPPQNNLPPSYQVVSKKDYDDLKTKVEMLEKALLNLAGQVLNNTKP